MEPWPQGTQSEHPQLHSEQSRRYGNATSALLKQAIPDFFSPITAFFFILQTLHGCPRVKNLLNAEFRESEEDFHL